jgi:transcriptional regulator with XRE-family HTH domain
MSFQKRLAQARAAMDWSQIDLAAAINAAQSTVASWESGKNEPDLATIVRIAKAVKRTPEYLAFAVDDGIGPDMVAVNEFDVRAVSGPGGLQEVWEDHQPDAIRHRYVLSRSAFRQQFGTDPEGAVVFEVIGDSMAPTLLPGERVFVNIRDRAPSPPGIFVVWDGLALVLKRVEFIAHSDPPRVRIISDNARHEPYERLIDEAYIQGRVIGSWQRR